MRAAAASLIASVQARASHAIDDARTSLVAQLGGAVETQLKRVELKLGQLEEMACLLRREREQLERARHGVYAERLLLESRHAQQLAAPIPSPPSTCHRRSEPATWRRAHTRGRRGRRHAAFIRPDRQDEK